MQVVERIAQAGAICSAARGVLEDALAAFGRERDALNVQLLVIGGEGVAD